MPINRATYEQTRPQLDFLFSLYLRHKTAKLSNVLMADSHIPCWSNAFFGDAWHLNQIGAEAYSRSLDNRLRALLAGLTDRVGRDHCS